VSSRSRNVVATLLATLISLLTLVAVPSASASEDAEVGVSIAGITPSTLRQGQTVRVTGIVENANSHPWTNVQVYMVVAASPYSTRAQVEQAASDPKAYTGVRLIADGTFDEIGDISAGGSAQYSLSVRYEQLGITGQEGVYPIGVQVLATGPDGTRSADALAKATTFVPLITNDEHAAPTSIVWPFLMPIYRDASGDYNDPRALVDAVNRGGQLRNLLDLAVSTASAGSTVVVDPALLVGIDDVSRNRHLPGRTKFTKVERAAAKAFLADLIDFARGHSPWILDYNRPDDLALSANPDLQRTLRSAITKATDATLNTYGLSGRRVAWPTRSGVTDAVVSDLRASGASPVMVTPAAVEAWEPRMGSLIHARTSSGAVPMLVSSMYQGKTLGVDQVVGLRQHVLTQAALAVLERSLDPTSKADSVVMVDPQWNPGRATTNRSMGDISAARFTQPVGLDSALTRPLTSYEQPLPATAKAKPLARRQLEAAASMVSTAGILANVVNDDEALATALAQHIAGSLAVHWRTDRQGGLATAQASLEWMNSLLGKISVEAPRTVTLSSAKGGFPLTIRNDTAHPVTVGVLLDSSNPALSVPGIKAEPIAPGESRTLTVTVDLKRERAAYVTANLVADDGTHIGSATTFQVRTSSIGVVLWIAMGVTAGLIVLAVVRRFVRRRRSLTSSQIPDTDD
jgi:hypothetical protein